MSDNDLAELKVEQRHMTVAMSEIAESVKKLTQFMMEQHAVSRANEEKFTRLHARIDANQDRICEQERSMNTMTTEIIPSIERDAAVKGAFWKMVGAVSIPIATAIGTIVWATSRFNDQSALTEAVQTLIKIQGG